MGVCSPGTIEEKIYQRQISKQGLSGAVVDLTRSSEHIQFSVEELKDLFTLHEDSPCVTHDLLGCECGGGKGPTGELCWFPQAAILSLETFKVSCLWGWGAGAREVFNRTLFSCFHL